MKLLGQLPKKFAFSSLEAISQFKAFIPDGDKCLCGADFGRSLSNS